MFYQQIRLKVALLLLLLIGLNIFIATSAIYSLGNGGFESSFTGSDIDNWVTIGNAQRVNWNKRTGSYSLVIKGSWSGKNYGGARQKVSVTAGTKYLLHFYYFKENGFWSQSPKITISWLDTYGNTVGSSDYMSWYAGNNVWNSSDNFYAAAPVGAEIAEIKFDYTEIAPNNAYYIDDVTFVAVSEIPFNNGGFENELTGGDLGNWVTTGNAQRVNWNKRTGNYSLVIKGTWDGQNPDNGGARQKVSVTAGTKYLLHFYYFKENGFWSQSPKITISWLDTYGNTLESSDYMSWYEGSNEWHSSWNFYAVAPAGAEMAEIKFDYTVTNLGAYYIDDVTFVAVVRQPFSNGDFETELTGSDIGNWISWGNAERVDWNKNNGLYSMVIKGNWAGNKYGDFEQKAIVTAGKNYSLTFYHYRDNGFAAASPKITIDWIDTYGKIIDSKNFMVSFTQDQGIWHKSGGYTGLAPDGAIEAEIRFNYSGINQYGACYIDDISFVEYDPDFFKAQGQNIIGEDGEPFLIRGVNASGWLNPEGYMWDLNRRPYLNTTAEIEKQIYKVLGKTDADLFYETYRANFLTDNDLAIFSSKGVTTIRLPFDYRMLSPCDQPGVYLEEGFKIIDDFIELCKKHNIYVILDMHGAPGGAASEDSGNSEYIYWIGNQQHSIACLWDYNPDYFDLTGRTPEFNQQRAADIWREIADHYKNEKQIIGYELINEPHTPNFYNLEFDEPLYDSYWFNWTTWGSAAQVNSDWNEPLSAPYSMVIKGTWSGQNPNYGGFSQRARAINDKDISFSFSYYYDNNFHVNEPATFVVEYFDYNDNVVQTDSFDLDFTGAQNQWHESPTFTSHTPADPALVKNVEIRFVFSEVGPDGALYIDNIKHHSPWTDMIRETFINITNAIREVDNNHIVFVEGDMFGEEIDGLVPPWDDNMAIAFHTYWRKTDINQIQPYIDARDQYNIPLWCSESGENTTGWFSELQLLLMNNNIGASWWGWKKASTFATAYYADLYPGAQYFKDHVWDENANVALYKQALMSLADSVKTSNCEYKPGFFESLFNPAFMSTNVPYKYHNIPGRINCVDYDLGYIWFAYYDWIYKKEGYFDQDGNHYLKYRSDGVDIQETTEGNGYAVADTADGEWMKYTVNVFETGTYDIKFRVATAIGGKIQLYLDETEDLTGEINIPATGGWDNWQTITVPNVNIDSKGEHVLKLIIVEGPVNLAWVDIEKDLCEGDFDGDGDVDGSDLAVFAADFGRMDCQTGPICEGDFDSDGDVDGSDLAMFAADFGRMDCPITH